MPCDPNTEFIGFTLAIEVRVEQNNFIKQLYGIIIFYNVRSKFTKSS